MNITDIFIRRPVLAVVVSLMILALGIRALGALSVRQFPYTENAVITVSTTYYGADPNAVASYITIALENSISQAQGIDYMTSTSTQNNSTIQVWLRLNYDAIQALSDINTKVNAILNQLPAGTQQPVITISVGQPIDDMYIGFYSKSLQNNQITDYLLRVVQPKLQAVNGVQEAEIIGERQYALRAWLNPAKVSAYNISSADVSNALTANNLVSGVGRTDGNMVTLNMNATTELHSVEEFKKLIIKAAKGAMVRLQDVAKVTLGAQNYNTAVSYNLQPAVYIGIQVSPTADLLQVINRVRQIYPEIEADLPTGLNSRIVYDSSDYVNASIHDVIAALIEALLIVTLVIFLFLGSLRSVIIPSVAMPLSLIGTFFVMLWLGYSINLLTLLALVLAIGLVVDDAIIVVENIERHIEEGKKPLEAAFIGAKELANPIIAITVVLVAVYLPIGFMGGLTGALFTEFAFTLAGAVAISAIIALTLSPMMCAKFLKPKKNNGKGRLTLLIDRIFDYLHHFYQHKLTRSLEYLSVTTVFASVILISIFFLFTTSKSELAPAEDQGVIISQLTAAPNAALPQTQMFAKVAAHAYMDYPETARVFEIDGSNGLNTSIVGDGLKPWAERKRTAMQLLPIIQKMLNGISGVKAAAFQRAPLPGGGSGLPIQFVIETIEPFDQLNNIVQQVMAKARASGEFLYVDSDLKIDKVQTNVEINRDKAAELGLTMQDIGNVLAANLSEGYVNYFDLYNRSYQVIPQVIRSQRLNADQLKNYYIKTQTDNVVPLSTLVKLHNVVVPETLNHFQQLNSATISCTPAPGVTQGEALNTLNAITKPLLPENYSIDYAGQSRQFTQESAALIITFFFALLIIFLSLSALFESFRDPLIVLISVPMSIFGALIFINLGVGGVSLNIYTEVGLVTLIGLISKHGILIVQFANDLQLQGFSKKEAVINAASIRLRPILMTTGAMVLGVVPLIFAQGAGAVSRFNIGLVIGTGIAIGTVFTLFVVPAMYMLLAENKTKEI